MSKALPIKVLRKLIDEASDVMTKNPEATVTLLIRGTYDAIGESDIGVRLAADTPQLGGVPASAEVGFGLSRHWEQVGSGEFVLRLERPGRLIE